MSKESILSDYGFAEKFVDFSDSGICVFAYDPSIEDFRFAFCNPAFYAHNSFIKQDLVGVPYKTALPMALENGMYDKVRHVYQSGQTLDFTLSYHNAQRKQIYQQFQIFRLKDGSVATVFNDITRIKQSETEIQRSQVRYSQTLNSLAYGVITTDPQRNITLVNRHACQILELGTPDRVLGQPIDNVYTLQDSQLNQLLYQLVDGFDVQTLCTGTGVKKLAAHRVSPLYDEEGRRQGYVYSFDDISSFIQTQEKLMFLNYHDANTQFYNRNFLKIFMANNNTKADLGVVYADINGLSRINDEMGTDVGDDILVACAKAFQNNLPENSIFVRFGEDDFIAIVFLNASIQLTPAAQNIQQEFEAACHFANTSLSVGTAIVGQDSLDLKDAIRVAQSKMISQKAMSSQSIRSSALLSLLATLEVKSHETEAHAQRLNTLAQRFAEKLQLGETQVNHLALLSVLHDIGKIGVPEFVLDKPEKLTPDEWKIMENHTLLGYKILAATPELEAIAPLVRSHHERWDGGGYPDGLLGEDIPLLSRIISLVDSYDAMTNDRVYRKALTSQAAMQELQKGRGTQFDPALVDVFLQILQEQQNSAPVHIR